MVDPHNELNQDYKSQDDWRQAITPSPSFSSSTKSYATANTSPPSIHYQIQPTERQELLQNAAKGIYSKKVPRKCPSYYKVRFISCRSLYRDIAISC
jgi:hypothetical protein